MRSASYKVATLLCLASCLIVAACVTINVYFPAAAAEKAADKIIDDVWGSEWPAGQEGRQALGAARSVRRHAAGGRAFRVEPAGAGR